MLMALGCGYTLGKLGGMEEVPNRSTVRLSVLASEPLYALEPLLATYDPNN